MKSQSKRVFYKIESIFNYFLFCFIFYSIENRLVCDCRLKWVFDLRKKTKFDDMRTSLQRIECHYDDASNNQLGIVDNTLLHQPPHGPNDDGQYEDEPAYDADLSRGNVIQLLRFGEEQLPCPQRLISDPTELPLPRESIGMDLSWRSTDIGSGASGGYFINTSFKTNLLLLCLITPILVSTFKSFFITSPSRSFRSIQ